MKYVYDDYGNKYEGMTKEEILQSIGAGGDRECVFTGSIIYNGECINFNYTGTLPDGAIIINLLNFGLDPSNNNLTPQEISDYLGLSAFSINYYYTDTEVYVTNATHQKLTFIKIGEGQIDLYVNRRQNGYFVKSSEKMNNIIWLTKEEFQASPKYNDVIYIVTNEEFTDDIDAALEPIENDIADLDNDVTAINTSLTAVVAREATDATNIGTLQSKTEHLGYHVVPTQLSQDWIIPTTGIYLVVLKDVAESIDYSFVIYVGSLATGYKAKTATFFATTAIGTDVIEVHVVGYTIGATKNGSAITIKDLIRLFTI